MDDEERREKALELHLTGTPLIQAMVQAGYAYGYAKRHANEFLDYRPTQEALRVVARRLGVSQEQWYAIMGQKSRDEELYKRDPKAWVKIMELLGHAIGTIKRGSETRPTVPINIHIHGLDDQPRVTTERPEEAVEGEVRALP